MFILLMRMYYLRKTHSRGHELKLFKKRARLDTRKHSFGYRTIDGWNSLPADVVNSSNIITFKNGLDKTWVNVQYDFTNEEKLNSTHMRNYRNN